MDINQQRKELFEKAANAYEQIQQLDKIIQDVASQLQIDLSYRLGDDIVEADFSDSWKSSDRCFQGEGWNEY